MLEASESYAQPLNNKYSWIQLQNFKISPVAPFLSSWQAELSIAQLLKSVCKWKVLSENGAIAIKTQYSVQANFGRVDYGSSVFYSFVYDRMTHAVDLQEYAEIKYWKFPFFKSLMVEVL